MRKTILTTQVMVLNNRLNRWI
ncbi:hypothetical protein Goshw_012100 [Gossypium schwendimanii]|uniref:Uncharacterized protein n=1 Tax=Gossypium schwendimanii TaxID=34291 RepID=A0A7J9L2S8_GOSSC|nr:hypothetical protein [Gossypium schwendimanii]